ncbi:MAG: hypothetical protein ACR2FJ_01630 [Qipengyuania sp.]
METTQSNYTYPVRVLYYATMLAGGLADPSGSRLPQERAHLLRLLGEVVASCRSCEAQNLCRNYAAALLAGDAEGALDTARRLTGIEHIPPSRSTLVEIPTQASAA